MLEIPRNPRSGVAIAPARTTKNADASANTFTPSNTPLSVNKTPMDRRQLRNRSRSPLPNDGRPIRRIGQRTTKHRQTKSGYSKPYWPIFAAVSRPRRKSDAASGDCPCPTPYSVRRSRSIRRSPVGGSSAIFATRRPRDTSKRFRTSIAIFNALENPALTLSPEPTHYEKQFAAPSRLRQDFAVDSHWLYDFPVHPMVSTRNTARRW